MSTQWTRNEAMLVLFEALQLVERHSLDPRSVQDWARESIEHTLRELDPYCQYLDKDAFARMQEAQMPIYGGVGMDLMADDKGMLRCFPYPRSPAFEAGIREGDELLSVDGRDISGLSPDDVAAHIRGEVGSSVSLLILRSNGSVFAPVLNRARVKAVTVEQRDYAGESAVRIFRFAASTPEELEQAIGSMDKAGTENGDRGALILDLRNNQGGDLYAAIACAALFLKEGDPILRIERKDRPEQFFCEKDGRFSDLGLIVLQNHYTASAAEVFLGALRWNGRARSYGDRTYGKGVTQRILPLSNKGALVLTDGVLVGPMQKRWDSEGIAPDGALEELPSGGKARWGSPRQLLRQLWPEPN